MSRTRIAILALAVTASGCGGSKSSEKTNSNANTQSAPQTTSHNEEAAVGKLSSRTSLVTKADAICARVNAKRASIKYRTQQDYLTKIPALAAYEKTAIAEMSKLTPSTSIAGDWVQILRATQRIAADTGKLARYIEAGNNVVTEQLSTDAQAAQRRIAAIAARDGFKECGRITD
jgi:hypothetical protein